MKWVWQCIVVLTVVPVMLAGCSDDTVGPEAPDVASQAEGLEAGEVGDPVPVSYERGLSPASHFPSSVDIVPATPFTSNCIPFGRSSDNFAGFIYANVPAFDMGVGDRIAFDLGAMNDVDIEADIFFATANKNPSPVGTSQDVRATAWTQVASGKADANPRGNTVVGDHELRWNAEAPFSFPGGGFIIGINRTNTDPGCEQVLVHGTSMDASGNFHFRFFDKSNQTLEQLDGGPGGESSGNIGAVVIETTGDGTGGGGGEGPLTCSEGAALVLEALQSADPETLPAVASLLLSFLIAQVETGDEVSASVVLSIAKFGRNVGFISDEDFALIQETVEACLEDTTVVL